MSQRLGGSSSAEVTVRLTPDVSEVDGGVDYVERKIKEMTRVANRGNEQMFRQLNGELSNFLGKSAKDSRVKIEMVPEWDWGKSGFKEIQGFRKQLSSETLQALTKEQRYHKSSLTSLRQQVNTARQKRDAIVRTVNQTKLLGMTIRTIVNPAWQAAQAEVDELSRKIDVAEGKPAGSKAISMLNKFNQVAMGVATAVQAVQTLNSVLGQLAKRQKEIQAFKLTFENIGVSAEGQDAILKSAIATSLTYGQTLGKIETAWKRLGPAIQAAGGSLSDTQTAIESISARTTMLGLSTEQTGRYIEAFAQVMGKGRLQSEELNQQFAELDGALRGQLESYFKATKGITDFDAALRSGEITSKMFLEGMNAISEVARENIATDFDKITSSIENIGRVGGPTLQQVQNQLMTLSTVGLTKVGETLAPLGRSLLRVQSTFVQMFTYIATEAEGTAVLFKGMAAAIGWAIEVPLKMLMLLFHGIMQVVNGIGILVKAIDDATGIFSAIGSAFQWLNDEIDKYIDETFELSEATTGSTDAVRKYEEAQNDLKRQMQAGAITLKEYNDLLKEQQLIQSRDQSIDQYESTKEVLMGMIEARKAELQLEKDAAQSRIGKIKEVEAVSKAAHESQIAEIKKEASEAEAAIDKKIKETKEYYGMQKEQLNEHKSNVKDQASEEKLAIGEKKKAVQEYYDTIREREEARFQQVMDRIEEEKRAIRDKYSSEISRLDSGPQAQKLSLMEIAKLRKEASQAETAYDRQKARAQIEQIQNAKRKAKLEKQQAEELKRLEEEKAAEEKRNAEEKARLDKEEKKRLTELDAQKKKVQEEMLAALKSIAASQKENASEEKKALTELDTQKTKINEKEQEQIGVLKRKREEAHSRHMSEIKEVEDKLGDQEKKFEDIERAANKLPEAQNLFAEAADRVTNGALQAQLTKVNNIASAARNAAIELGNLEKAKEGAGAGNTGGGTPIGPPAPAQRYAGGDVSGGHRYTVNELGQEGFLSSSGQLSSIKAPAWGTWKAPSSGTVIPAHVWGQLAASSQPNVGVSPKGLNGISGGAGSSQVVEAIRGLNGASNISNSVTIQSANPTQTANNMLVQLQKIRSARIRRR